MQKWFDAEYWFIITIIIARKKTVLGKKKIKHKAPKTLTKLKLLNSHGK